jgi:hypothetical protein
LTQHYYDSRGVARVYEMSLADGAWKLWREAPGFCQRFSGVLSDDGTRIDGAWQKSDDGAEWTHDFDPETLLVFVDEPDQNRCGRSSSAAKKAEAALRISFARRSSRTSARNLRSSADSSLVIPGRCHSIDLSPANPPAQRLTPRHPQLRRYRLDGGRLRRIVLAHLGDHPDRALAHLRRIVL